MDLASVHTKNLGTGADDPHFRADENGSVGILGVGCGLFVLDENGTLLISPWLKDDGERRVLTCSASPIIRRGAFCPLAHSEARLVRLGNPVWIDKGVQGLPGQAWAGNPRAETRRANEVLSHFPPWGKMRQPSIGQGCRTTLKYIYDTSKYI